MERFNIRRTDQGRGPTFHFPKGKMSANFEAWDIGYYK